MRPPHRIPLMLQHLDWILFMEKIQIPEEDVFDVIDNIVTNLPKIKKYWTQNPDLRLIQVLVNLRFIPYTIGFWYYYEETDFMIGVMNVPAREILMWGQNYDKNNNLLRKTKWRFIKDMNTDHIKAILESMLPISYLHKIVFEYELKLREKI